MIVTENRPIQNIWAIGRNFTEHAKELGHSVPDEPLVFLKSGGCIVSAGRDVVIPEACLSVHYEVEVAVRVDEQKDIAQVGLAVDLTDRDKQKQLKEQGRPWTLAKSFRNSCPLSRLVPPDKTLWEAPFQLFVNGQLRQEGYTEQMIHPPEKVIAYINARFPLGAGDLILLGTPSGVGRLNEGDQISVAWENVIQADWHIRKEGTITSTSPLIE